jgi:hypothetical protein
MVLYVVGILALGVAAVYLFSIGWWGPAVLPGGLCLYMIYLVVRVWRWWMGILTYIKIGAAVVIIAVLGYFVWNYQHMAGKIVKLEEQVAGLELRAEIIERAQKATDEFNKKKTTIQRKVASDKTKVDQAVEAGDDAGMRNLFIERGLLDPKASPPAGGSQGRPGNPSSWAPGLYAFNGRRI